MTYPVKFFSSKRADGSPVPGAPTVNGTAGSLLNLLQTVLVDGFNLIVLDSVTISDGVATATKAGHGFQIDDLIIPSWTGYAGSERYVTAVTGNTFSWVADDSPPAPSGTLQAKFAPATGWTRVFSGTNKAVWRSDDIAGSRRYYRIDDSNAQYARLLMYRTMSDVDTGVDRVPLGAQMTNGVGVLKSTTANSTARDWFVAVDPQFIWLGIDAGSSLPTLGYDMYGFGDPLLWKPGDQYGAILIGHQSDSPAAAGNYAMYLGAVATSIKGRYMAADTDEATQSPNLNLDGGWRQQLYPGQSANSFPATDAAFGGIEYGDVVIFTTGAGATSSATLGPRRGKLPGILISPHGVTPSNIPNLTRRPATVIGLSGVSLITLYVSGQSQGAYPIFIPIKGPSGWAGWR